MTTVQAEDLAKEQTTDSLFHNAVDGGRASLTVEDKDLLAKLNSTSGGRDNEAERVRALLVESGRSTEVKFAVGDRVRRNHDDKEGEVVAVEGEDPKIRFDGEPKAVQYRYKRALILLARVTEASNRHAMLAQDLSKRSQPLTGTRSGTKLINGDDCTRVCSKEEVHCGRHTRPAEEGTLPTGGGLGYSMSARVDGPEGDAIGRISPPITLPASAIKARTSSFSGGSLLDEMRNTTKLMNQAAATEKCSNPSSPRPKPPPPRPTDAGKNRSCSRFACTVGENDLCDGDDEEDEIQVTHRPSQYHSSDGWRLR